MSSNCDSDGIPVDHDGHRMEDFVSHTAPFAIRADVLQEICSGYGRDLGTSHLETVPMSEGMPSSSGGIALENVVLVEDGYSSDETQPPVENDVSNMSATVQAILKTTKHEREALISTKAKLSDVLCFLRKKGFSETQIYEDLARDGFVRASPARDEFGLPDLGSAKIDVKNNDLPHSANKVFESMSQQPNLGAKESPPTVQNPLKDKMKQKIGESTPVTTCPDVPMDGPVGEDAKSTTPTWSSVVKNNVAEEVLSFDYCPMAPGASKVTPPSDVLKKGMEKFKCCLVGNFSKGTLPLSKVMEIAKKSWDSRGLCHVSQKDSHTFLFKFASERDMNVVLARGTWYFDRKPLILTAWGTDLGVGKVSTIPLWVKFKNIPDYYWTREGLSCVASSIGPPICADKVTSQLNPVPFAKLCVKYTVGEPLPESVKVALMDVNTMELSETEFATVEVSYPQKPLICSGCKSLGHLVGACPTVKRVWVEKSKVKNIAEQSAHTMEEPSPQSHAQDCPVVENKDSASKILDTAQSSDNSEPSKEAVMESKDKEEEWTTVGGKKSKGGEGSSTQPAVCAQQMPIYAALAKSLTKGQQKRARKAVGKGSPKTR